MDAKFVRLRPDPKTTGLRLAVWREYPEDNVEIREETTLPERVGKPDAHRVEVHERLILTPGDVAWLHGVLGELRDREIQNAARAAVLAQVLRGHVEPELAAELAQEAVIEMERQNL